MKIRFLRDYTWLPRVTSAVLLLIACGSANALPFLVGAAIYDATSTGAPNILGFRYSTNSADSSAALPLDQVGDVPDAGAVAKTISFELAVGDNVFTFDRSRSVGFSPTYYGLNLFFNGTGVSYNPPQISPAIIGDLVAAVATGTGSFFVPAAGTLIPNYGNNGTSSATVSTAGYSGATSFSVGGYDIAVGGFDIGHTGSNVFGSFTVTVAQPSGAVPEPSMPAILLLGLAALGLSGRFARVKQ